MSEDQPQPPQSNSPTSWRDVYALVQDSERRLTQTITDGFARASSVSADHEVRLRVVEASTTSSALAMAGAMKQGESIVSEWGQWRQNITADVNAIKQGEVADAAKRSGSVAVLTGARAVLLVVASVLSSVVAVASVVFKL